ncbi:MAG: AAA family ATPase [Sphingobacteriia bacterium]|nr:AAA family ATPase [Sphingobacteriia bacterium]
MQILGHKQQIDLVLNRITGERPINSWLFTGPKGIGKATAAKFIATKVLKTTNIIHPEILIIDSDSIQNKLIPIEKVREVGEFVKLTSTNSGFKIIIIDDIDSISINAANALLKVVEEPKTNVFIFLISHNVHKVIKTIKSRCAIIKFLGLSSDLCTQVLDSTPNLPSSNEIIDLMTITDNCPGKVVEFINTKALDFYYKLISIILNNSKILDIKSLPEIKHETGWFLITRLINICLKLHLNVPVTLTHFEEENLPKIASNLDKFNLFNLSNEANILLNDLQRINMDYNQVIFLVTKMFERKQ